MRYVSDDGKVFNELEECKEYEKKQREEELKNKEKDKRWKEIEEAYCKFNKLLREYHKDFPPEKDDIVEAIKDILEIFD